MMLDRFFESADLSLINGILTFIGLFSTVYVMQLSHLSGMIRWPTWLQVMSRVGFVLLVWGMLWSLSFSFQKGWQPWVPMLMVYFAVDILMVCYAIALWMKARQVKAEESQAYRAFHR